MSMKGRRFSGDVSCPVARSSSCVSVGFDQPNALPPWFAPLNSSPVWNGCEIREGFLLWSPPSDGSIKFQTLRHLFDVMAKLFLLLTESFFPLFFGSPPLESQFICTIDSKL